MNSITPFLWFDDQAEEAAGFYTSLFDDARITSVNRYGEAGPGPEGSVMTVGFELLGKPFIALNGGPEYRFTEAVSFMVQCDTQEEVDRLWAQLTAGGSESACGWLKDRYGLSWQIVPKRLFELLSDPDPQRSQRAMRAMLGMHRIDSRELERAAAG
jgi:predicted 3-demethylubiquinone-9 3-methyltransferase (glyoxalase superfamily)